MKLEDFKEACNLLGYEVKYCHNRCCHYAEIEPGIVLSCKMTFQGASLSISEPFDYKIASRYFNLIELEQKTLEENVEILKEQCFQRALLANKMENALLDFESMLGFVRGKK